MCVCVCKRGMYVCVYVYIYIYTHTHTHYIYEITRKKLIWYGHVERMDSTWLPKIIINWKPEG